MMTEQAPSPPEGAPAKRTGGRAGRNLPAAIGVGLALGGLVVVTLFVYRPAFVGVVVVAIGYGLYELVQALRTAGRALPLVPLLAAALALVVAAYAGGADALALALFATVAAVAVWRLAGAVTDAAPTDAAPTSADDGADPGARPAPGARPGAAGWLADLAASTFAVTYVPFLAGFAVLLLRPHDGDVRVIAFIATVVCSDVGGYAAGVLFGRHPMAPTVSPKKSWEGFAGSAVACVVAGVAFLTLSLGGQWWQGVLYGLAVVCSATLGDLGESMLKRDLGIKDMGTLLPGHGGLMDRLDSLLPTAPVAWLLLSAFVPPHP